MTFVLARLKERRRYSKTEIAALDRLRPHLHRATLIGARLGLERTYLMTETLARLGLAAAVISPTGRVIESNSLLNALSTVFSTTAFGGVAINDKAGNEMLKSGLEEIRIGNSQIGGISIPIRGEDSDSRPPLIIHLLPVRGAANDIFAGGQALMVVCPLKRQAAPASEILHGLFDFSPAEARLVSELAIGMTMRQIVEKRHVSMATLRTQVRSVLNKTRMSRMTDLSQLLAQIPSQDRRKNDL